jgi:phenylacetate-CoA ligase
MMRRCIADKIGLTLYDRLKNTTIREYFSFYKQTLNWSSDRIKEYQLIKLTKLITHAYSNIPYYRKLFDDNNISPEIIKDYENFKKVPYLLRDDIKNNLKELTPIDTNLKHVYRGSSSGSTGKPINYYIDNNSLSAGRAAMYVGWSFAGWNLGDKGLHIWGNPRVVKEQWKKTSSIIKEIIFNHYKYPAYKLTDYGQFNELIRLIKSGKYTFIDGYTTAIYLLANYVKENNLTLNKFGDVLTTAETLQDYQRVIIEETLGPVYDGYGCSEIEGVANQCIICKNYHIIDPHVIVEYENSIEGQDESKEIVVTELDNYIMPFIRYKIGDMAIKTNNNCEINFSSLKKITGRSSDIIRLPGGGNLVVSSFFGAALMRKMGDNIKQYQIVKTRPDKLIVKLSVNDSFKNEDRNQINRYIDEYLQDKIQYEVQIVDRIDISATGKYKLLIDETRK